ncbi:MAG: DUF1836 domain-containing protein [Clostridia bacterium]|nr:DUF1836 domain-containing protein [Clostridia bacterium]
MPASITAFRLPRFREIPDVGLYLDQTVKYINRYLEPLGGMEITSSMVSNYVKKGYIKNPIRKQYDAEQIAHLIAITIIKNVVSMEHCARLFDMQKKMYSVETAYNYFCCELENMLCFTFGLKDEVDAIGTSNTELKRMLRSVIIAVANIIYVQYSFETVVIEDASQELG